MNGLYFHFQQVGVNTLDGSGHYLKKPDLLREFILNRMTEELFLGWLPKVWGFPFCHFLIFITREIKFVSLNYKRQPVFMLFGGVTIKMRDSKIFLTY